MARRLAIGAGRGHLVRRGFEFLQAEDVGLFARNPLGNLRVPRADAVHVPGGDLHSSQGTSKHGGLCSAASSGYTLGYTRALCSTSDSAGCLSELRSSHRSQQQRRVPRFAPDTNSLVPVNYHIERRTCAQGECVPDPPRKGRELALLSSEARGTAYRDPGVANGRNELELNPGGQ